MIAWMKLHDGKTALINNQLSKLPQVGDLPPA
jgi:hypothetical protein